MIKKLKSGSHREDKKGKGRCDLLPAKALLRVSKRLEVGARKYEANDWDAGIPKEMLIDSALRHLLQYMSDMKDEDHLSASVTNLLKLMEQEEDEMPKV